MSRTLLLSLVGLVSLMGGLSAQVSPEPVAVVSSTPEMIASPEVVVPVSAPAAVETVVAVAPTTPEPEAPTVVDPIPEAKPPVVEPVAVVVNDVEEPVIAPAAPVTAESDEGGITAEMVFFINIIIGVCLIVWLMIMHAGQRRRVREEINSCISDTRQAMAARIDKLEEEHLEEIGKTEGRLTKKIEEGDDDVRRRLESAESRLIESMERERELVYRQLEGHNRLREDLRSQRRIDAVVELYDDDSITDLVTQNAEVSVQSIARLIAAGIRELRSDIECIHAINRLVHRGTLEALDHDLMRRILAVGVRRFFVTLDYQPHVVSDEMALTMARVRQVLARLEAEREVDPLEHFIPAKGERKALPESSDEE